MTNTPDQNPYLTGEAFGYKREGLIETPFKPTIEGRSESMEWPTMHTDLGLMAVMLSGAIKSYDIFGWDRTPHPPANSTNSVQQPLFSAAEQLLTDPQMEETVGFRPGSNIPRAFFNRVDLIVPFPWDFRPGVLNLDPNQQLVSLEFAEFPDYDGGETLRITSMVLPNDSEGEDRRPNFSGIDKNTVAKIFHLGERTWVLWNMTPGFKFFHPWEHLRVSTLGQTDFQKILTMGEVQTGVSKR